MAGGNEHEESWCRRDHLLLHPQVAQPHQDQLDHVNNAFSDCDTPATLIISGFISSTKQTYWGLSLGGGFLMSPYYLQMSSGSKKIVNIIVKRFYVGRSAHISISFADVQWL